MDGGGAQRYPSGQSGQSLFGQSLLGRSGASAWGGGMNPRSSMRPRMSMAPFPTFHPPPAPVIEPPPPPGPGPSPGPAPGGGGGGMPYGVPEDWLRETLMRQHAATRKGIIHRRGRD